MSNLSRRSLLKAMGLGTGALVLGFRPALAPPGTPLAPTPVAPVPGPLGVQKLGVITMVSRELLEDSDLLVDFVEPRARRELERGAKANGLARPVSDEAWDYRDDFAFHLNQVGVRVTQLWEAA
jgi:hypothetical protein